MTIGKWSCWNRCFSGGSLRSHRGQLQGCLPWSLQDPCARMRGSLHAWHMATTARGLWRPVCAKRRRWLRHRHVFPSADLLTLRWILTGIWSTADLTYAARFYLRDPAAKSYASPTTCSWMPNSIAPKPPATYNKSTSYKTPHNFRWILKTKTFVYPSPRFFLCPPLTLRRSAHNQEHGRALTTEVKRSQEMEPVQLCTLRARDIFFLFTTLSKSLSAEPLHLNTATLTCWIW